MPSLTLKPTHKVVTAYYDNLAKFARLGIKHETAVRSAFQELLADRDVHILDPFTGTGNFIVNIMRHIPKTALPRRCGNSNLLEEFKLAA